MDGVSIAKISPSVLIPRGYGKGDDMVQDVVDSLCSSDVHRLFIIEMLFCVCV